MTAAVAMSDHLGLLIDSFRRTASKPGISISTDEFVQCCDTILPFFEHLGPVFHVARGEFQSKLETLKSISGTHSTLEEVVRADKVANKATVKNSPTRNLHRLLSAIMFIKLIFERLMGSSSVTLKEAAGEAYEATLAPYHTGIIRGVVRAGLYTLPSREHFLVSIGETEESAGPRAKEVVASCMTVVERVQRLFLDIRMPASDVWLWPSK